LVQIASSPVRSDHRLPIVDRLLRHRCVSGVSELRCDPENYDRKRFVVTEIEGWLLVAANGELCGTLPLERHAARPLAQAEAWRRVPAKWFGHASLAADLDSPSALALSGPGEYAG
jgi:hypothetical protein